ncbi:MAG TPA: FMN-binding negative transcriptional regulator [Devosia sp.]|nr:FMN-binding negative transcriptional regulator [Devosia sp.]
MYSPPAFREDRLDVLHALIEAHPLGTLITGGGRGLEANLVPFTLHGGRGAHGTLLAHLAKANDQLAALRDGSEVLVIFQGAQSYITPNWYSSKAEHGKVVPTWNYIVVQARGVPVVIDDAAWLRRQVGELTDRNESPRPSPWAVDDAPEAFVAAQLKGIVGIEIPVARIEGKWKTSQNRPEADRIGVSAGLAADGHAEMAEWVARR